MGAAKRRKLAGTYPTGNPVIPDDLKTDIATSVRGVEFYGLDQIGGLCLQRNSVGYLLMMMLGWKCNVVFGGLAVQTPFVMLSHSAQQNTGTAA
jgi:hypothetical protein